MWRVVSVQAESEDRFSGEVAHFIYKTFCKMNYMYLIKL